MRRWTAGLFAVVFLLLTVSTAAVAQIKVKAPIPFAFTVDDSTCSPATYAFEQEDPRRKMSIRGDKGTCALVEVSPFPPKHLTEPDATWLIFHRYGDKNFLAEIWSHRIGRQFSESKTEKQLRESGAEANNIRVAVK